VVGLLSKNIPASYANVEFADGAVLLRGEVPMLYVGPQIIEPPQPAALATSLQPCCALKLS
jgi:hypothetical protein